MKYLHIVTSHVFTFLSLIINIQSVAQNVGVDVASPLEKLDVAGAIKIGPDFNNTNTAPAGGAGTIRWNGTNFQGWDGSQWITFGSGADADWTISNNDIYNANSGNVGIGTSAPLTKLHLTSASGDAVFSLTPGTGGSGRISFRRPNNNISWTLGETATNDFFLFDYQNNATPFRVDAGAGNAAMRISSSGKVGLGTGAPGSLLHLQTTATDETGGMRLTTGAVHSVIYHNTNADLVLRKLNQSNQLVLDQGGNVGVGTETPADKLEVQGNIRMVDGNEAVGYIPVSDANGKMTWTAPSAIAGINKLVDADNDTKIQVEESADEDIIRFDLSGTEHFLMAGPRLEVKNSGNSVFIGEGAGANDDLSFNENVFIGRNSGNANTTGLENTAIGYDALRLSTTGTNNTAVGNSALRNSTTANFNTAMGWEAMRATTTGNNSTAVGHWALHDNTTGVGNLAVGSHALRANVSGGSNTALGVNAGQNNLGSGNVFIGRQAGQNEVGSNKLYIDNSNTVSPLLYGEFDTDLLRINGTLNINNAYSFPTSDGSIGHVLSTNGSGVVSWTDPNLIVTNDADWTISGSDQYSAVAGNVGVGTSSPDAKFQVVGRAIFGADGQLITGSNGFIAGGTGNQVSSSDGFVSGNNNNVSGDYGAAFGASNTASGNRSFVINQLNRASGNNSFAGGFRSLASANLSIAIGGNDTATADLSAAFGAGNYARSYAEMVMGSYATDYTPGSTNSFNSNDRVFTIGNGTGPGARSNALTVYKSGVVNINDAYSMPTADGSPNFVMKTDGSGNVTWANVNTIVTGLLPSATSGQTLRHNGTNWVSNSNLYNDGTNIGIGITPSTVRMDITGTNAGTNSLQLRSGNTSSGTTSNQVLFGYNGTEDYRHAIKTRHNSLGQSNNSIDFYVWDYTTQSGAPTAIGTKNVMTIAADGGGRVGIGNSSPASVLHVAGTGTTDADGIRISGPNGNAAIYMNGSGDLILRKLNLTDQLVLDVGGNIGIGTSGPAQKLDVQGSIRMADGNQQAGYTPVSTTNGTMVWTNPANITTAADGDGSSTNELQTLSQTGLNVTLSNGGGTISVADNDNSTTNEIQTLSVSGNQITLSNGGGTVTVDDGDWAVSSGNVYRSSGNVGIGQTSPSEKLHVGGNVLLDRAGVINNTTRTVTIGGSRQDAGNDYAQISFQNYDTNGGAADYTGARISSENDGGTDDGSLSFHTADNGTLTKHMTITSEGKVGIGVGTPISKLSVNTVADGFEVFAARIINTANSNSSRDEGLLVRAGHNTFASGQESSMIQFESPNSTYLGRIRQSGSNSVDYVTTSDIRLKTDIVETRYGLDDLLAIEVKDYHYKADKERTSQETGFIAQQLYDHYPTAVDVGGENVEEQPWGVAYGKLTPLLVKAIQDQQKIIEDLRQRIEQLETK